MPMVITAPFTGGVITQPIIAPDGSASAPMYSFGNNSNMGMYRAGTNILGFATGGSQVLRLGSGAVQVPDTASLGWVSGENLWRRDSDGAIAQRNGATAQTYRIYNTFTDASNYERVKFAWESNTLVIGAEHAGTGTARDIKLLSPKQILFELPTTQGFRISMTGAGAMSYNLEPSRMYATDNTVDLGITNFRFKNFFQAGYHQLDEMTAPSAPSANAVRVYAEDNGSGKTRLMALFPSGAAQQIAIEP